MCKTVEALGLLEKLVDADLTVCAHEVANGKTTYTFTGSDPTQLYRLVRSSVNGNRTSTLMVLNRNDESSFSLQLAQDDAAKCTLAYADRTGALTRNTESLNTRRAAIAFKCLGNVLITLAAFSPVWGGTVHTVESSALRGQMHYLARKAFADQTPTYRRLSA